MTSRTEVSFDGDTFVLAPEEDIEALKRRIETAAHTDGMFVDFEQLNHRDVSVLVSSRSSVVVSIRATGVAPLEADAVVVPFGGTFDF